MNKKVYLLRKLKILKTLKLQKNLIKKVKKAKMNQKVLLLKALLLPNREKDQLKKLDLKKTQIFTNFFELRNSKSSFALA